MAVQPGQVTWENQGNGTNDNIVSFETSKNIFNEYRKRGIIGKISKPMGSATIGAGPNARQIDVGGTACVSSKTITSGDEVRFTLERNITGAGTYGDAKVRMGDYIAYMHARVFVNQTDSPAIPLQGDMSQLRVADVLGNQESQTRRQVGMWFAEEQAYKFYDAIYRGASSDLMAPKAEGGRALDLGLGAGVQISPENYIVAGDGPVSGTPGTSGYETALRTALIGLTNTAGDMFSLQFLHNLPYYLARRNIAPAEGLEGAPGAKYICLCDPDLLATLTGINNDLPKAWKEATERSQNNKYFTNGEIEYNNLVLVPDEYLRKYRADVSGAGIIWGTNLADRRDFQPTATAAHMVVLGATAVLEANNGSISITEDKGFHGKGKSIAAHIKQSYMRTRWVPKDGSGVGVLNQQMLACSFYQGALTW